MPAQLRIRRRTCAWSIALALLTVVASASDALNEFCPVMTDEPALAELSVERDGRTIRFCCEKCVRRFREDPGKYLRNLPPVGATPGRSRSRFAEINAFRRLPPIPAEIAVAAPVKASLPEVLRAATLGLAAALFILLARFRARRSRAEGKPASRVCRAIGAVPLLAVGLVVAVASALLVSAAHAETRRKLRYWERMDFVHNATFHDFGYPPRPARDPRPRGLDKTYYRGNDERDERLWNGGNYRTATFHLSLVDGEGKALDIGDAIDGRCLVRVRFERSPNTEESFYVENEMQQIYLTRSPELFQGTAGPVDDAVRFEALRELWEFEARFELPELKTGEARREGRHEGMIYIREKSYRRGELLGGRFHFGIRYELALRDGRLAEGSDLSMGALYRSKFKSAWAIPPGEWFSHEPIPLKEEVLTRDPALLGVAGEDRAEAGG